MKPFMGPKFQENQQRCKRHDVPCGFCGKPIKDQYKSFMVFICCDDFQPDAAEPAHRLHGNNMGGYPLGPDCARRLKKIRPELFS